MQLANAESSIEVGFRIPKACKLDMVMRQKLGSSAVAYDTGLPRMFYQEDRMEGLIKKTSKLVGLAAGAALALSFAAGCSSGQPDPAQRAVNAANRADQAASRAEAAATKSQQSAAQAQAAASRVEQAASDAKAAADRAEAIAAKTMAGAHHGGARHRRHKKAEEAAPAEGGAAAAPAPAEGGAAAPAPAPAPATP
jgi:hypothetical protein